MIRVCGLWVKKGHQSGEEFLVGNSGALAFFVRKNNFAGDNPNEPAFILSVGSSNNPRKDMTKSTFDGLLEKKESENGDEEVPVGDANIDEESPDAPF